MNALEDSGAFDRYAHLQFTDEDPMFRISALGKKDTHKDKVNLVFGAYRNHEGNPHVLDVVKVAEKRLVLGHEDQVARGEEYVHPNKEYQTIPGHPDFLKQSQELMLGKELATEMGSRIASMQTLSGTGALKLAADWYGQVVPINTTPVFVSNPTWSNHNNIFELTGFRMKSYRYYNSVTNGLDFVGMVEDLNNAPKFAIVILQSCAHNPTGVDPNHEQWEQLADLCLEKRFNVLLDQAYQGLATGDLEKDAFAPRLFARKGVDFCSAQSYSKNMGLYGERVGCFSVMCATERSAKVVVNNLEKIIRVVISTPPLHGPRLVHTILSDREVLYPAWVKEVTAMAERVIQMRSVVHKELLRLQTPGDWSHFINQIGMFTYTGLTSVQCQRLIDEFHVYLLMNGRVNMAGLTTMSAVYFARCIHQVTIGGDHAGIADL